MSRVQSSIGAAQHYGPRETNTGLDNSVSTMGLTKQRELYVDWEQANAGLPTSNADDDAAVLVVPAGSIIKNCYFEVETAWTSAGLATLELDWQQTDGTNIGTGALGIDTIAKATLVAGALIHCDGALSGNATGTAQAIQVSKTLDAQIAIDDKTAAFTAGTGRLIVEYMEPYAKA